MGVVRLPVITGATASGKSALAMAIATRHPVTIISADSRQVYRRFDIGTAKPSAEDRTRVPHAGIDVADPDERYNAARWAAVAERAIGEAHAAGRTPLLVGGTGLYLRALFEPLFHEPELDAAARLALEDHLATLSTAELRRWVEALDPARAPLGRTQLLRAAEVALLTGVPISTWHREAPRPPRFAPRYLVADAGAELAGRIERRVDEMLDVGWLDEVRTLERTTPPDAPAWKATGYESLRRLGAGMLDRGAARRDIIIGTRQYAKRQRTWIRHQLPADLVTPIDTQSITRAADEALGWWSEEATT